MGSVVVVLLVGPPGVFLASYIETRRVGDAYYLTSSRSAFTLTQVGEQLPVVQGLLLVILFTVLLFIGLYVTRYLRLNVQGAEETLSLLSPRGVAEYRDAFGQVSSLPGALVVTILLALLYIPPRISIPLTPVVAYSAIAAFFDVLIFGTALWVYVSLLRGVFRFGRAELDLKKYYEDKMLGLRPLGSLAITSGLAFLLFVIVALPGAILATDPGNLSVLLTVFSLGTIMLFLSLDEVHRTMVAQKMREETSIHHQFNKILRGSDGDTSQIEKSISEIKEMLKARIMMNEVSEIPTWPFETRMIERFVAIVLAIISVILARLFEIVLHP